MRRKLIRLLNKGARRTVSTFSAIDKSRYHSLTLDLDEGGTDIPVLPRYPRNWTVITSIGVSAPNGFVRDHVWHEHCALEVDGIGAGRNANGLEFAPCAVITDTARFFLARDEMQLHALVADYPEPRWHAAIMLLTDPHSTTLWTLLFGRRSGRDPRDSD